MKKNLRFAYVLAVPILILFVIYQMTFIPIDSDYSNLVLEANDILKGNYFLSDWNLTGISFITTDLLYFITGSLFGSVSELSYYIATGLMISFEIILAILLCRHEHGTSFDGIFVFLFCGVPCHFAMMSLRAHTGAMCCVFLAILFLHKDNKRPNVYNKIVATVALSLGCAGDAITLITGVLPLILYYVITLLTSKETEKGKMILWRYIFICASAAFLGVLAEKVFFFVGGANKNAFLSSRTFEPLEDWGDKFLLYIRSISLLGDASFWGERLLSLKTISFFINTIYLLLGFTLVFRSVLRLVFGGENDFISSVLSIGFLFLSIIYVITDISKDVNSSRYLATYIAVFAVLIVRNRDWLFAKVVNYKKTILALTFGCALISFGFRTVGIFTQNKNETTQMRLAAFLEEKDLHSGYASFWNSSSVTVLSDDSVKVRSIIYNGFFFDFHNWFSKDSWYKEPAYFVVCEENDLFGVSPDNVKELFGNPDDILNCEEYIILVYDSDISNSIHMNCMDDGTILPKELFRNSEVTIRNNECIIDVEGFLYGPYATIPSGDYLFTYTGENLDDLIVDIWSNSFGEKLPLELIEGTDTQLKYKVTIPDDLTDVEFREYNGGDTTIKLEKIAFSNVP